MRNEINVFRFVFAYFHFRFASDAKTSENKPFFRIEAKKFCFHFASKRKWRHFFASVSLHFASKRKWRHFFRFCFASFRFEAKMMGVFSFRFALFRFEAKMIAIFSLLFRFVFASFHFRFVSDFYGSHRCEISEKSTFSHRSEKNFASVSLHFASKRKWQRTLAENCFCDLLHH